METILEKVYERHDEWVYLVINYGCNRDTAEDIVQDMYLRLTVYLKKTGADITYKDDINIYFIGKTLKSIYIDHIRKHNRKPTSDYDAESYHIGQDDPYNYEDLYKKVQVMLGELYWFDRKVYEIIESGEKVSELAHKTTIPYYTIYNTYKRVKEYLKENL